MTKATMTSLERVLTSLSHKEPDRVPFFLLLTMHGAKELRMPIKEYFSRAEHVAEGQLRLREKYQHDCLYTFFYAPIEVEAWGGDVIYAADGPPNSGTPFIRNHQDIRSLAVPDIDSCKCLQRVLKATEILKASVRDEVPIIGVVMSPFSLPVMQMGFPGYLDLMFNDSDSFNALMAVNEAFCVAWANAQLAAGATAICYFDPMSSPTIVPKEVYLRTGHEIARRTLSQINGPTATHLASGMSLPIISELADTGTAAVGVSSMENLADLKTACRNKLTVIGNLNGIEMRRWTSAETEEHVRNAIRNAGAGGGFILSDNHGEIPWQTPDSVLSAISEAVREWGRYPIDIP